jgi:GGDEF domain-containing protein
MSTFSRRLRYRVAGLGRGGPLGLADAGALPTFHELLPLFERELRRARRYERPLSVLVLAFETVEPIHIAQLRVLHLGALLRDTLRESDLVAYAAESQEFVAVLPETDSVAAEQSAKRIHRLLVSRMATGLRAAVAVFPHGGLTLDDLVARARSSLRHGPLPLDRVATVLRGGTHG